MGNREMKALVWHGKEDIRYDTVSDPEIEDDRDAIIKVTSCTCGVAHHEVGLDLPQGKVTVRTIRRSARFGTPLQPAGGGTATLRTVRTLRFVLPVLWNRRSCVCGHRRVVGSYCNGTVRYHFGCGRRHFGRFGLGKDYGPERRDEDDSKPHDPAPRFGDTGLCNRGLFSRLQRIGFGLKAPNLRFELGLALGVPHRRLAHPSRTRANFGCAGQIAAGRPPKAPCSPND